MREITQEAFADLVETTPGLVVVDFFKPDCQPCRIAEPMLDALATEFASQAAFVKVDAGQAPDLVTTLGLQSVPTVVFFLDGVPVDFVARALREPTLRRKIATYL